MDTFGGGGGHGGALVAVAVAAVGGAPSYGSRVPAHIRPSACAIGRGGCQQAAPRLLPGGTRPAFLPEPRLLAVGTAGPNLSLMARRLPVGAGARLRYIYTASQLAPPPARSPRRTQTGSDSLASRSDPACTPWCLVGKISRVRFGSSVGDPARARPGNPADQAEILRRRAASLSFHNSHARLRRRGDHTRSGHDGGGQRGGRAAPQVQVGPPLPLPPLPP